ncbi:MAG: efflux RND transporter permease subunit [Candidatus Omnitrophica bacterium]|nr:efflux RND transporter permease subunit [Candidatus Omnitrophota bacterium]
MGTFGLILLGVISFARLPQELFPPISFPQVTVVTEYVNAAPEEIETLITKPIEEAIGSVSGLKRIESISREGRSTVIASFNWGQDIDFAALAVREKIDLVKERLPKESEDPVVLKFDPLSRPIMLLSVTGPDLDPARLKLLTEKMLKDNLEKIEGVASASISGGVNREILIEIDQSRLQANHLSLLEVIESIENANVSYPAGSIKKGLYEYLIRTSGEFRNVREINFAVAGVDTVGKLKREDTSFVERSGTGGARDTLDVLRSEVKKEMLEKRLVLVRDIATVTDGFSEATSVSRYNNISNISLAIQKQASANSIKLVDAIRKNLEFLRPDLEARGLKFEVVYDHSVFIRNSLENLLHEAVSGGVLAFIVLFIFLRAVGPSLLVTLSIPVTVMGVFFLMATCGITINIMSLGGLALGVGMIVDTSIVVLENIFRRRQLGENAEEGAIRGTTEVIWPVISSNLTTIAVFFPLIVFVPGIPGQLFKDLSWTVIFSQIIATFIPLTLIAMISVSLKIKNTEYKPFNWTKILEGRMQKLATPAKQNMFLISILLVVMASFSIVFVILPNLEREVLPKVDQGQFLIKVDMPIGTRLEVTNRICTQIEQALKTISEVEDVAVTIGSEKSKKGEIKVETLRPSQAIILVKLHEDRQVSSTQVVSSLRDTLKDYKLPDAEINFVLQESEFAFAEGGAKPVLIEVKGYDYVVLEKLVERLKQELGELPGIIEVQDDMGAASPETKLEIDKKRAALYGISALDIAITAKSAIEGVVATQYREAGQEYDVRLRLSKRDREDIENLNRLLIYSKVLDALIPLKEVARIERGAGPSEIKRVNQERTVIISADVQKTYKTKDVLLAVQEMLRHTDIPSDFQVVLSGKAKEVKENFSKLTFAFVLSILLVYMIMASQFESFLQPLIIMFTVPLAFIGVSIALWVSGSSINVIALLGIVMLGGIVVNNGIVLIEYMNQLRDEGMDVVEAAFEAAKVRTRPILMSSLTTIVGLIPLALGLGDGAELRSPMAIAVMGGLISSTFLTLVVIPSIYILVTRTTERLFGEYEEEELEEETENSDEK